MELFDTARRAVVPFEPSDHALIYTCGITPYDSTHLGHAFTFVTYDVLVRRLIDRGHRVSVVRNVTDIDDPLFAKAAELGVDHRELASREEQRFDADMAALNVSAVVSAPRASSAIPEIIELIGDVLGRGAAYQAGGAVYFAVGSYPRFGALSSYTRTEMLELAAERGGNPDDPNKRDPLDFVLWQPCTNGEPAWDSPWGPGRPGWHVECSALALRDLGPTIDLHGGGTDLIFPHHECELAQSETATGRPFVRHWMHVAMVFMDGHKMSKSLGNLVFVDRLRAEWDPMVVRAAIIDHHYRHEWEWHDDLIHRAARRVSAWRATDAGAGQGSDDVIDEVRAALDADLDTPAALEAIDRAAAADIDVRQAAALLGIAL